MVSPYFDQLVENAREGVSLVEADATRTIRYVNPAFERLTGFEAAACLGRSLDLLGVAEESKEAYLTLLDGLDRGEAVQQVLRCRRRDGSWFWNQVSLAPLPARNGDPRRVALFHRDVTEEGEQLRYVALLEEQLAALQRQLDRLSTSDPATGAANRRFFDQQLSMLWRIAARAHESAACLFVELDQFDEIVAGGRGSTEGPEFETRRAALEEILRGVAQLLDENFQRAGDIVARYDDRRLVVVSLGAGGKTLDDHASRICRTVHGLRRQAGAAVPPTTVTVADSSNAAVGLSEPQGLLGAARAALAQARGSGGDCAVRVEVAEPAPFTSADAG